MNKNSELLKEIKGFFTEEEYIPVRFGLLNMVLLGGEIMVLTSGKALIKIIGMLGMPIGAFMMNREMAKFMECMLNRR